MPVPDVLREGGGGHRSVGFTQRGAGIAELLDKQADLIDYYKDQLERTMQDLMTMNDAVVRVVATANPDLPQPQHPNTSSQE